MISLPLLYLFELFISERLLVRCAVAHFILKPCLILLLLPKISHQLCLKLDLGISFLLLSGAFVIQLIFKLLLHSPFLFFFLLALLADLLFIFLSLVVYDLSPLILREHGSAIDP